jgi:hypothetical protein
MVQYLYINDLFSLIIGEGEKKNLRNRLRYSLKMLEEITGVIIGWKIRKNSGQTRRYKQ